MSKFSVNVNKFFGLFGYKLFKVSDFYSSRIPIELNDDDNFIIRYVFENNLSMTSIENLSSTALACKYVLKNNIIGDFVECGVWRGGHALIAAYLFKKYSSNRNIWLFDTFKGMTSPSSIDAELLSGTPAIDEFNINKSNNHNNWCYASLDDVNKNFRKLNLLSNHIKFIQGDILDTLNCIYNIPDNISILRLDTDWYESTSIELKNLYPKLSQFGVLCIDDYGHWSGSKRATDEYFSLNKFPSPFFQAIDYSARCCIKP